MASSRPVDGTHDHQAKTRRLHLHIPNSYPRATSPRSSPVGSPSSTPALSKLSALDPPLPLPRDDVLREKVVQSYGSILPRPVSPEHEEDHPRPAPSDENLLSNHGRRNRWTDYFRADITSGESSRDFLARERTYFSWLRLATFLAIASVALFLRLRLRTFSSENSSSPPKDLVSVTSNDAAQSFAKALAKKALRKRLISQRSDLIFDVTSTTSSTLILQKGSSPYPPDNDDISDDGILDSVPIFSKALGAFFFALSLIALIVGHIDYMRCERALEEADKLIALDEQGSEYNSVQRYHSARSAKQAHSNRLVHVVEIIIAMAIFAVALIILITVKQGEIDPVEPTRLEFPL